ncbi:MAG: hypothetical protein IPP66_17010 [Anaerolineales bacterium]|nr:hypothetical protein [Anaerolineales bacterium]
MNSRLRYDRATKETAENLQVVAKSLAVQKLTKLSLPQMEAVVDLVAKVIPAGNVPGMILSGLTNISGKNVQPQKARQDINVLFKEVSVFAEKAKYGALFVGPAAIIWGYQNLLKLAGKDPESAFPEGVWQFYVDYALREDTARHANETNGFDLLLEKNNIRLSDVDRLTAWAMASINGLHQYHSLLASEWFERTALWLLQEATGDTHLYRIWDAKKPYVRDAEGANYDYPGYRRLKFEQYLKSITDTLSRPARLNWERDMKFAAESLPAYQRQMSILAYLDPNPFGETRVPISLEEANIGIIHNGNYFLLPVCEPGTSHPADVLTVRAQISMMLSISQKETANLADVARIKRASLLSLRKKLNPTLQTELEKLRYAPILLNSDSCDPSMLLSEIRQGERGVGDHALTIFDTGKSFVFDQSHIFFDGGWGAVLAEIMTNEALSWAVYLNMLGPAIQTRPSIYTELNLAMTVTDKQQIAQSARISPEAGAENSKVNTKACVNFRHYFQQRSDFPGLTINDLLVLYRAIHAFTYQPGASLRTEIDALGKQNSEAADQVRKVLKDFGQINPSILIPVDASKRIPRDRIYPMNMEVPLVELDLLKLHNEMLGLLTEFESTKGRNPALYERFYDRQIQYLATLGGFGTILAKAKEIAVKGESASVGAIKLLAHLPLPLKQLLDKVPARYEKLNNILKGTEVLSNLGAVAKNSSLTRFITAKDDNEQKQMAWGVMTDAKGVMHITLRDFRPHVAVLHEIGRKDLANQIAQDYLDTYVQGLNQFVNEITRIAVAQPRRLLNS